MGFYSLFGGSTHLINPHWFGLYMHYMMERYLYSSVIESSYIHGNFLSEHVQPWSCTFYKHLTQVNHTKKQPLPSTAAKVTYRWSQVSVLKHQPLVVQRLRKTQNIKAQTRPRDPQGARRSNASLSFTLGLPRIIHLLAFHSPVHMNGSSLSRSDTHTQMQTDTATQTHSLQEVTRYELWSTSCLCFN